ncbi:hypothetical protein BC828DRAFT_97206 [Blastocladiella britannica]|nr:hypothetical protein BC828DRAFT_97206 [Blastocladiella britannica]
MPAEQHLTTVSSRHGSPMDASYSYNTTRAGDDVLPAGVQIVTLQSPPPEGDDNRPPLKRKRGRPRKTEKPEYFVSGVNILNAAPPEEESVDVVAHRRATHNNIERRRREHINNAIQLLSTMIPYSVHKGSLLSKANTLDYTIEYMRKLVDEVAQLSLERATMLEMLAGVGIDGTTVSAEVARRQPPATAAASSASESTTDGFSLPGSGGMMRHSAAVATLPAQTAAEAVGESPYPAPFYPAAQQHHQPPATAASYASKNGASYAPAAEPGPYPQLQQHQRLSQERLPLEQQQYHHHPLSHHPHHPHPPHHESPPHDNTAAYPHAYSSLPTPHAAQMHLHRVAQQPLEATIAPPLHHQYGSAASYLAHHTSSVLQSGPALARVQMGEAGESPRIASLMRGLARVSDQGPLPLPRSLGGGVAGASVSASSASAFETGSGGGVLN